MTETHYANFRGFFYKKIFLKYVQITMILVKKRLLCGEKVSVYLQTKIFQGIAPVQTGCKFDGKAACTLLGTFNSQCLSKVGFRPFLAFLRKFWPYL